MLTGAAPSVPDGVGQSPPIGDEEEVQPHRTTIVLEEAASAPTTPPNEPNGEPTPPPLPMISPSPESDAPSRPTTTSISSTSTPPPPPPSHHDRSHSLSSTHSLSISLLTNATRPLIPPRPTRESLSSLRKNSQSVDFSQTMPTRMRALTREKLDFTPEQKAQQQQQQKEQLAHDRRRGRSHVLQEEEEQEAVDIVSEDVSSRMKTQAARFKYMLSPIHTSHHHQQQQQQLTQQQIDKQANDFIMAQLGPRPYTHVPYDFNRDPGIAPPTLGPLEMITSPVIFGDPVKSVDATMNGTTATSLSHTFLPTVSVLESELASHPSHSSASSSSHHSSSSPQRHHASHSEGFVQHMASDPSTTTIAAPFVFDTNVHPPTVFSSTALSNTTYSLAASPPSTARTLELPLPSHTHAPGSGRSSPLRKQTRSRTLPLSMDGVAPGNTAPFTIPLSSKIASSNLQEALEAYKTEPAEIEAHGWGIASITQQQHGDEHTDTTPDPNTSTSTATAHLYSPSEYEIRTLAFSPDTLSLLLRDPIRVDYFIRYVSLGLGKQQTKSLRRMALLQMDKARFGTLEKELVKGNEKDKTTITKDKESKKKNAPITITKDPASTKPKLTKESSLSRSTSKHGGGGGGGGHTRTHSKHLPSSSSFNKEKGGHGHGELRTAKIAAKICADIGMDIAGSSTNGAPTLTRRRTATRERRATKESKATGSSGNSKTASTVTSPQTAPLNGTSSNGISPLIVQPLTLTDLTEMAYNYDYIPRASMDGDRGHYKVVVVQDDPSATSASSGDNTTIGISMIAPKPVHARSPTNGLVARHSHDAIEDEFPELMTIRTPEIVKIHPIKDDDDGPIVPSPPPEFAQPPGHTWPAGELTSDAVAIYTYLKHIEVPGPNGGLMRMSSIDGVDGRNPTPPLVGETIMIGEVAPASVLNAHRGSGPLTSLTPIPPTLAPTPSFTPRKSMSDSASSAMPPTLPPSIVASIVPSPAPDAEKGVDLDSNNDGGTKEIPPVEEKLTTEQQSDHQSAPSPVPSSTTASMDLTSLLTSSSDARSSFLPTPHTSVTTADHLPSSTLMTPETVISTGSARSGRGVGGDNKQANSSPREKSLEMDDILLSDLSLGATEAHQQQEHQEQQQQPTQERSLSPGNATTATTSSSSTAPELHASISPRISVMQLRHGHLDTSQEKTPSAPLSPHANSILAAVQSASTSGESTPTNAQQQQKNSSLEEKKSPLFKAKLTPVLLPSTSHSYVPAISVSQSVGSTPNVPIRQLSTPSTSTLGGSPLSRLNPPFSNHNATGGSPRKLGRASPRKQRGGGGGGGHNRNFTISRAFSFIKSDGTSLLSPSNAQSRALVLLALEIREFACVWESLAPRSVVLRESGTSTSHYSSLREPLSPTLLAAPGTPLGITPRPGPQMKNMAPLPILANRSVTLPPYNTVNGTYSPLVKSTSDASLAAQLQSQSSSSSLLNGTLTPRLTPRQGPIPQSPRALPQVSARATSPRYHPPSSPGLSGINIGGPGGSSSRGPSPGPSPRLGAVSHGTSRSSASSPVLGAMMGKGGNRGSLSTPNEPLTPLFPSYPLMSLGPGIGGVGGVGGAGGSRFTTPHPPSAYPTTTPSPPIPTTATFSIGRGAKVLAGQLQRIKDRYLVPTSAYRTSAVDVPDSILDPLVSQIDTFCEGVKARVKEAHAAQHAGHSQQRAVTAGVTLDCFLFSDLWHHLLQSLSPAFTTHSTESLLYVTGLRAGRARWCQSLLIQLVREEVDGRILEVQKMWQANQRVHGSVWPVATMANTNTNAATMNAGAFSNTQSQLNPYSSHFDLPSHLHQARPLTPLSNSPAHSPTLASTQAAAAAAQHQPPFQQLHPHHLARDNLVLAKLLSCPWTLPYLKGFYSALQSREDELWMEQEQKMKEKEEKERELMEKEKEKEKQAATEEDDTWLDVGTRERRGGDTPIMQNSPSHQPISSFPSTLNTTPSPPEPTIIIRRYPHDCFLFYHECVAFSRCPRSEYRHTWARKLIHHYITGIGSGGLSMSHDVKRAIVWACTDQPPAMTFEPAKEYAFTVMAGYFPLFTSYPGYSEMMTKIDAFNTTILDTLDDTLRNLFFDSSPFSLLPSQTGDDEPSLEDILENGLEWFQHYLMREYATTVVASTSLTTATDASSSTTTSFDSADSSHIAPTIVTPAAEDNRLYNMLLLYLDITEFQKIPPQHATSTYLSKQASKLYDQYLRAGSNDHVAIPKQIMSQILLTMDANISPMMFHTLGQWILMTFKLEVYQQFLGSDLCTQMKAHLQQVRGEDQQANKEEKMYLTTQRIQQLRSVSLNTNKFGSLSTPGGIHGHGNGSITSPGGPGSTLSVSTQMKDPQTPTPKTPLSSGGRHRLSGINGTLPILLFNDLMQDPILQQLFKSFLESNFASESMLFYLEVQQYKCMPQSDFLKTTANKIQAKYIKLGAKMSITYLSEECRATISSILASPGGPTNLLFASAEAQVYQYLSCQQYPEFIRSRQYAEIPIEYLHQVIERQQQHSERDATLAQGRSDHEASSSSASNLHRVDAQSTVLSSHVTPERGGLTADDARARMQLMWTNVTLDMILADPLAVARFKQFATRHACQDSLFFWLACEEYRYIPSTAYLRVIASKIYATHIVKDARLEVNLPSHIYAEIEAGLVSPTKKLFASAQQVIYRLMNSSAFPQFLASAEYRAYFEDLQKIAEPQSSKWSRFFSSGTASGVSILPPAATTISAVPTTIVNGAVQGMSLSYADEQGLRRTSLFPSTSHAQQGGASSNALPPEPASARSISKAGRASFSGLCGGTGPEYGQQE